MLRPDSEGSSLVGLCWMSSPCLDISSKTNYLKVLYDAAKVKN